MITDFTTIDCILREQDEKIKRMEQQIQRMERFIPKEASVTRKVKKAERERSLSQRFKDSFK